MSSRMNRMARYRSICQPFSATPSMSRHIFPAKPPPKCPCPLSVAPLRKRRWSEGGAKVERSFSKPILAFFQLFSPSSSNVHFHISCRLCFRNAIFFGQRTFGKKDYSDGKKAFFVFFEHGKHFFCMVFYVFRVGFEASRKAFRDELYMGFLNCTRDFSCLSN